MSIDINLKVVQVFPPVSGVSSQGKPWTRSCLIGETFDMYPKKIYVTIFNPNEIKPVPMIGQNITASIEINSRSYIGTQDQLEHWSTDVVALRIIILPQQ